MGVRNHNADRRAFYDAVYEGSVAAKRRNEAAWHRAEADAWERGERDATSAEVARIAAGKPSVDLGADEQPAGPRFWVWTPVTEAMPKVKSDHASDVVIVTNGRTVQSARYYEVAPGSFRWETPVGSIKNGFTHWMPMPPAPKGGDSDA